MVAMLSLTMVDVIGIKLFRWPVPGAPEMVGFLGVVVIAFAMTYTLFVRGHIQVEFFVMHMPKKGQLVSTALVSLLGLLLFALLSWQSFEYGHMLQTTGEVSMTQRIPFYPFVYAMAFCCIPVCLVLLLDFIQSVMKAVKN